MEHLSINRARRIFVLFTFFLLFFNGCKSTTDEDFTANCRTQANENCASEEDNGDDRGYNPCLVNNNLPVCKK
jgi:hypothetical protein